MLSFEEFQNQVLKAFKCTKEECEFWDSSYYFSALINYTDRQWLFFTVKYSIDPDAGDYGRWSVVKEYDKGSDSLIEAVKILEQQTEQCIRKETAVLKHLEKLK